MRSKRSTSLVRLVATASFGSRRPIRPVRRESASRSPDQRLSDTVAASPSGSDSLSSRWRQGSSTTRPSLSNGIERLLERRGADPAIGLGEALAVAAQAEINLDQRVDSIGDLAARQRRADDGAERGVVVGAAADGDLVELLAVFVDAENADIAHVVMAASVNAARDLAGEIADLVVARGKVLAQALGDRDRARVGETAIVVAGAGDDVAGEARIAGAEAGGRKAPPQRRQFPAADMRQHHGLLVGDADLATAACVGEIGEELHLLGAGIARRASRRLQRHRDDGIAGR